ncbi:signal-regulatory protein beta-2-like [Cheilinus undulatus]|uniref:signal-regulatory protein beta-2-like n=1 Tax=Cheilinus undulatus TaxID=241271 RepID=UPI001BD40BD7|nr:signal-regulatory protein beta-2-like [Cheilinus undulatus]
MIKGLTALIFLGTICQTINALQPISVIAAEPGENVTVPCSFQVDEAGLLNWYKLKFGYMVQAIATGSFDKITLEEQFNNPRFTITNVAALYYLTVRNVSKEDEATYFCQVGTPYTMKIMDGIHLAVNDHKNHQSSVYIKQIPESQSIKAGDSVSLQCSLLSKHKETREQCPGEHNVYWLKAGAGESHPAVIYSQSDDKQKRSCAYSFLKTIESSSDAGTYYCAVVTCGQILFGEGTTLDTKIGTQDWNPILIVLGTLLALCVIVIAVLIFATEG